MQTPATPAASVYHLSVKPISRSVGRSATAAAAYRSGELIVDERTGEVHDYTRKGDVVHSEMIVPPGAPSWAEDRAALWNAAEAAEKRKDARVARDYEVAIPKELTRAQGIELVRDFAQQLADRYGVAVDVNVHSDELRNWDGSEKGYQGYHAHILTSTRKLGREGFGEKAEIELSDAKRKSLGLSDGAAEIEQIRQRWEIAANRHLERAGQSQRIDRRSLKDQGIDREPTVHLGPGVTALERDGVTSRLGDINRRVMAERQIEVEERSLEQGLQPLLAELQESRVRSEAERGQQAEREKARQEAARVEAAEPTLEQGRAALKEAMAQQILERNARVQRVLRRAQERQERRQHVLEAIAARQPEAPQGRVASWTQKSYEEAMRAWEWSKVAASRLVEQAQRLAARIAQAAHPQRLAEWAQGHLRRERPDLVQPDVRGQEGAGTRQRAVEPQADRQRSAPGLEGTPAADSSVRARRKEPEGKRDLQGEPSVEPLVTEPGAEAATALPKRDWNRYKKLQQELAQKGLQSLQERGVVRGPEGPGRDHDEPDPPEREHEKNPSRGRGR